MADTALYIRMFGGFEVRHHAASIGHFNTRKTALLLAYLAFHSKQAHPRELLVDLLWPESEPEAARTNLRVALNALRKQLTLPGLSAEDILLTDRTNIQINPQVIATDVMEFDRTLKSASSARGGVERRERLTAALDLYLGDLLPAYYEDWILMERERIREQYLEALRQLAALLEEEREWSQAIACVRRLIKADPLEEAPYCRLMRLYMASGQQEAALRLYRVLERVQGEELGQAPSEEAQSLLKQIRSVHKHESQEDPPTRTSRPGLPPRLPHRGPGLYDSERETFHAAGVPVFHARFFGREAEMEYLQGRVSQEQAGLITLTGPAGVGKTRLAAEFARRIEKSGQRSVWFVTLADVADVSMLPAAVQGVLCPGKSTTDPLAQIVATLSAQPSLLVLDSCEHLSTEGGLWVRDLLHRTPCLTCLVTSRRSLNLVDEQEIPVSPLSTPPVSFSPERLVNYPCVQLLLDRAQRIRPDFQVTERNAPTIAILCAKLEGLPLAVELAAGWAQMLTPVQMLSQLASNRFSLLVSRKQDITVRQRTLHAAIEASYLLLSPPVRRFFTHLSIFRGGWSLQAAESVCQEPNALELLAQLRANSLLLTEETGLGMRYRMLETLREYAGEQWESGERARLAENHASYFLQVACDAEPKLAEKEQALALSLLQEENDNLQSALTWLSSTAPDRALEFASALWRYWYLAGYLREGRGWLETILQNSRPVTDNEVNGPDTKETLEAKKVHARALNGAGVLAWGQGDYIAARQLHLESLLLRRQLEDRQGVASSLNNLGLVSRNINDLAAARQYYEESLSLFKEVGSRAGIATASNNLGSIYLEQGDYAAARLLLEEALDLYRSMGDRWSEAVTLHNLGDAAFKQEDFSTAQRLLRESLAMLWEIGDRRDIPRCLVDLAMVAMEQGKYERAVRLLAVSEATCVEAGVYLPKRERAQFDHYVQALHKVLSEADFRSAWEAGRCMPLSEAVDYALQGFPLTARMNP